MEGHTSEKSNCNTAVIFEETNVKKEPVYKFLKRFFDIASSFCAILVLCIPLFIVWLTIRLTSKGSAIFLDHRVGKNGKDIYVYKFRTMYIDAEEHVRDYLSEEQYQKWLIERKVDNDPRITPVGRFLRKTSIDELHSCLIFSREI